MSQFEKEDILPPLIEDDRMWTGLCYPFWFVMSPLTVYTKKKEELFVYFHALQSLYLGAVNLIFDFFLFFMVYFLFFHRDVKAITSAQAGSNFGMALGFGYVSLIMMFFYMVFLFVQAVITFYLGWRASQGKLFHLPFIGQIAREKMSALRSVLESDYDELFGSSGPAGAGRKPLPEQNEISRENPLPDLNIAPLSPAQEKFLKKNPPIDKLKSIFSAEGGSMPAGESEKPPIKGEKVVNPALTAFLGELKAPVQQKPATHSGAVRTPQEQLAAVQRRDILMRSIILNDEGSKKTVDSVSGGGRKDVRSDARQAETEPVQRVKGPVAGVDAKKMPSLEKIDIVKSRLKERSDLSEKIEPVRSSERVSAPATGILGNVKKWTPPKRIDSGKKTAGGIKNDGDEIF